jgi:hypothetical protein
VTALDGGVPPRPLPVSGRVTAEEIAGAPASIRVRPLSAAQRTLRSRETLLTVRSFVPYCEIT